MRHQPPQNLEGIFQAPVSHSYTSPTFKGPRRGGKMPLLCPRSWGQCRTHPPGQLSLSHLASVLFCSCVGGLAFLPGEFQPDCQRIPAETEVGANVKFSQDKGQLGGVGWEERGGGCVK